MGVEKGIIVGDKTKSDVGAAVELNRGVDVESGSCIILSVVGTGVDSPGAEQATKRINKLTVKQPLTRWIVRFFMIFCRRKLILMSFVSCQSLNL